MSLWAFRTRDVGDGWFSLWRLNTSFKRAPCCRASLHNVCAFLVSLNFPFNLPFWCSFIVLLAFPYFPWSQCFPRNHSPADIGRNAQRLFAAKGGDAAPRSGLSAGVPRHLAPGHWEDWPLFLSFFFPGPDNLFLWGEGGIERQSK